MSKRLANLLDKSEDAVGGLINKLEALSGHQGVDLKVLTSNNHLTREKIASLGLDPHDTIAAELYHALLVRYESDSARLDKALGLDEKSTILDRIQAAADVTKRLTGNQEIWALKPTAAKQLLRQKQPKKLMKRLNYRAVESMVKRESVEGVIMAAQAEESVTWKTDFRRAAAKLDTSNYALKQPSFVLLQNELRLASQGLTFEYSQLLGAVGIWSSPDAQADALTITLRLASQLRHLGIDISRQKLSTVHPALKWWHNTDDLIYEHEGQTISLNIEDVADNYLAHSELGSHSVLAAQQSLWQSIKQAYGEHAEEAAALLKRTEAATAEVIEGRSPLIPAVLATETVEVGA